MRSRLAPLLTVVWGTAISFPAGAATYYASPNGSDKNPGTLNKPWRTLQAGKKVLKPGDTLLIADGHYPGGVKHNVDGAPGKPITYRAMNPGRAIVRGDQTAERDAFVVYEADWVVVDGIVAQGAARHGIWISSSNSAVVRNCIAQYNGVSGIFTSYSDDLLIENNESAFNREQHGIYVSNGGDRPIVRDNVCHGNGRCGIQLNGDGKQIKPALGSRGDGIIVNAIVDRNTIYGNGASGGAGINLLSVRLSRIANNLIFHNLAGGIALWNDNRKDATQWGSKGNMIVFNTIYFRPNEGRWCLSFLNGSTSNVVANNILSGGSRGAYQFDQTSSFTADHNLVFSPTHTFVAVNEATGRLLKAEEYYQLTKNDAHSIQADPKFMQLFGPEPDFHLRPNSPAWKAGLYFWQVPGDIEGNTMNRFRAPNMGCFGGAEPVPVKG